MSILSVLCYYWMNKVPDKGSEVSNKYPFIYLFVFFKHNIRLFYLSLLYSLGIDIHS